MPSGPEVLILIVVVAMIVLLALALTRLSGTAASAAGAIKTTILPTEAHMWLGPVIADLYALPKHSVAWLSHDVAVVTWTRRPGWAWVIAIFRAECRSGSVSCAGCSSRSASSPDRPRR